MKCNFCSTPLKHSFCNLGTTPLANAYLKPEKIEEKEPRYALHVFVCSNCFLVQLNEFTSPDHMFSDYAYFSSFSETWLLHVEKYTDQVVDRFRIENRHLVIEIASNDGYLLQFFQKKGIPVLGIEPAKNVAEKAEAQGIPTMTQFFSTQLAQELASKGIQADLLIGNNVLAHIPNLNDFVAGMKIVLKPKGCITLEFPHLLKLMQENQFDTIYHEHCSYFSLITLETIFSSHGLKIFDVEEIPTHGGSLRLFVAHAEDNEKTVIANVGRIKAKEVEAGLNNIETYTAFNTQAKIIKSEMLAFLEKIRLEGKTVAGYGAPAKGNTLLNYCGIDTKLISYTVDISPHKQGLFLPGSRIPIYSPAKIKEAKPDFLVILPWNLKEEIMRQMTCIKEWGGKFVIPIPRLEVVS